MDQTEMIIFLVLINIVVVTFIAGIVVFIFQYRKRKLAHQKEKDELEKQHQLDLLNTQLSSQNQTMQFIGQEIHDSVAQQLTLASIYAQQIEFDNRHPQSTDKLMIVNKIINDSLLELRQLSKNLTDDKVQHADLNELIEMECERVNTSGICEAVFTADCKPVINIASKSSLFRIIQEFIQNSIKHSGCSRIKITLEVSDSALMVLLQDDGKGFDTSNAQNEGIGLNNIRRRVQMLEGKYDLRSALNKGVQLKISLPLSTNKSLLTDELHYSYSR